MKYQALVDWVAKVRSSIDPESPHAPTIDGILTILSNEDLKDFPAKYIEIIRDQLSSLIKNGFKISGVYSPGELYEKLESGKKDRKELEEDIIKSLANQEAILKEAKSQIEKADAAKKVRQVREAVSPDEMRHHMDNIADALKQGDTDQVIYHLFSLNASLNKIKPFVGRGKKIATKKAIYDFNTDDWIKFISEIYPELQKNYGEELLKPGSVLAEAIQSKYNSIDMEDEEAVAKFSIPNTMFKVFAGLAQANFTISNGIEIDFPTEVDPLVANLDFEMSMIRHLSMKTPIETILSRVDSLFSNEEQRNSFKRKLYKYQTEHAREIFDAQMDMAKQAKQEEILREVPTYKDHLNLQSGEEKTGDTLYKDKEAHSAEVKIWEENYKNKIVPEEAEKRIMQDGTGAKIAFNFLKNIQNIIFSTKWKVSKWRGTEVYDNDDHLINIVPKNMVKMLDIIENALKKDPVGKTDVWVHAFNDVAKIGKDAAKNKPISIFGFGKRDVATQEFYDRFVTAFANRDLYIKKQNVEGVKQRK